MSRWHTFRRARVKFELQDFQNHDFFDTIHVLESFCFDFQLRNSNKLTRDADFCERSEASKSFYFIATVSKLWKQNEINNGCQISFWYDDRLTENSKGYSTPVIDVHVYKQGTISENAGGDRPLEEAPG